MAVSGALVNKVAIEMANCDVHSILENISSVSSV
jgi:hypothetical protein